MTTCKQRPQILGTEAGSCLLVWLQFAEKMSTLKEPYKGQFLQIKYLFKESRIECYTEYVK